MARIDLSVSSAPDPVGSGARAAGIGSAFIALADDATAASWNPGGLTQLERPEFSVVGRAFSVSDRSDPVTEETETGTRTVDASGMSAESLRLNFLSFAVPFSIRSANAVFALTYQEVLSFDRRARVVTTLEREIGTVADDRVFAQQGSLYSMSPAVAIQVGEVVSAGVALNHWFDGIGTSSAWSSRLTERLVTESAGESFVTDGVEQTAYQDFSGTAATFGVLIRPTQALSLGGVGRVPFTATFVRDYTIRSPQRPTASSESKLTMRWPASLGLGFAYRWTDSITTSADATYVDWGDFFVTDSAGNRFLVSGDPIGADNPYSSPTDPAGGFHVDPVVTARIGAEEAVLAGGVVITFRQGAFYDPEPSRGTPESCWGASAGLGVTLRDLSFDVSYQARWGRDIDGISFVRNVLQESDGSIDFLQQTAHASLIYYL